MAIKAVLFDKDGTLVDFNKTWLAVARELAAMAADGDPGRASMLLEIAGYDATQNAFRADSVFAAGTNADIVALWYPEMSASERQAQLARFDAFTAEAGAAHAVALEGVPEALRTLYDRGLRLGVATNDSTAGAEKTVLALGLAQLFIAVYGYDAVANPKPAPDGLRAFADLVGCHSSEIAMVGDNRHDMEMARSAGAGLAVGVLSGTGTRQTLGSLADLILASVADLPEALQSTDRLDTLDGRL